MTFRFKKFECSHGLGAMKIGVDAVLVGAWADVSRARRILDVGTGCGVIALMCAQRNPEATIDAIDIDPASVGEATANFAMSQWSPRLKASLEDFSRIERACYDLIVSNPPYFNSGIDAPDTPRLRARHQGVLSPAVLLEKGVRLLSEAGKIAMIVPYEQTEVLMETAAGCGLHPVRTFVVKGHANAPAKRAMLEFSRVANGAPVNTELVLESAPCVPTDAYRELCKDFYLKF